MIYLPAEGFKSSSSESSEELSRPKRLAAGRVIPSSTLCAEVSFSVWNHNAMMFSFSLPHLGGMFRISGLSGSRASPKSILSPLTASLQRMKEEAVLEATGVRFQVAARAYRSYLFSLCVFMN
jgi:hypothetical protein